MNRREALVRIGVATGTAVFAPPIFIACARPADRPQTPTRPPAAGAPRADQTPTEAPKPTEKGVINGLRFTPVFVGNSRQSTATPEGFKKWEIALATFNLTDQLRGRTSGVSGGRQVDNPLDSAIKFHVQSGDFSYPESRASFTGNMVLGTIPPGHGVRSSLHVDIPLNARGLKLVASAVPQEWQGRPPPPQEMASWNLEGDFPPFGQERKVDYFPADAKFKRLGEAIDQGPLKVTALKALLAPLCGEGGYNSPPTGGLWYLLVQFKAENRHGYSLGHNQPKFQITDSRGQTLNTSAVTNTIPEVPPGMEKIFYAAIWASPTNGGCKPVSPPEEIKHLGLVVFLPPLTQAKTGAAWGSYDIPNPTVIPPVIVPASGFGRPDLTLPTVEKVFASIGK